MNKTVNTDSYNANGAIKLSLKNLFNNISKTANPNKPNVNGVINCSKLYSIINIFVNSNRSYVNCV